MTTKSNSRADLQLLSVILDHTPAGVVVVDAQGKVILENRRSRQVCGCGAGCRDRCDPDDRHLVCRRPDGSEYAPEDLPLSRARRLGQEILGEEVRVDRPDGASMLTLVSATPTRDGEGRIAGAIGVIQDMTALENRGQQRGEFLSMVNHELRAPLATIKGLSSMALGSRGAMSAADVQDFFGTIDEETDCLMELVNNLSQMTRIESGRFSVFPEPTDLAEVVEEAVAAFRHRHGQPLADFQSPGALPLVMADRQRVAQVLTNLLENAARFSPPQKRITIAIEPPAGTTGSGGPYVAVHVRDQGAGISPDKLPMLFEKFAQLHNGHDSGLSGTGLGLFICKGIIEAHGGRIRGRSLGVGHGTTITFTLPVAIEFPREVGLQPAAPLVLEPVAP